MGWWERAPRVQGEEAVCAPVCRGLVEPPGWCVRTRACHAFTAALKHVLVPSPGDRGAGGAQHSISLFICHSPTMEVSHSVKERTIAENSLVILLQGLHGHVTTVDLRDESTATGRVANVDAFMNMRLAEVTFTDRRGEVSQLDEIFVTGRNVRYVHIPDEVDIRATIERQLQAIHRVRYFGGRDKGRREFPRAKHK